MKFQVALQQKSVRNFLVEAEKSRLFKELI